MVPTFSQSASRVLHIIDILLCYRTRMHILQVVYKIHEMNWPQKVFYAFDIETSTCRISYLVTTCYSMSQIVAKKLRKTFFVPNSLRNNVGWGPHVFSRYFITVLEDKWFLGYMENSSVSGEWSSISITGNCQYVYKESSVQPFFLKIFSKRYFCFYWFFLTAKCPNILLKIVRSDCRCLSQKLKEQIVISSKHGVPFWRV